MGSIEDWALTIKYIFIILMFQKRFTQMSSGGGGSQLIWQMQHIKQLWYSFLKFSEKNAIKVYRCFTVILYIGYCITYSPNQINIPDKFGTKLRMAQYKITHVHIIWTLPKCIQLAYKMGQEDEVLENYI